MAQSPKFVVFGVFCMFRHSLDRRFPTVSELWTWTLGDSGLPGLMQSRWRWARSRLLEDASLRCRPTGLVCQGCSLDLQSPFEMPDAIELEIPGQSTKG